MKLKEKMPELTGATKWLNSKGINREALIGHKPVLFHFWSVSCDLCKNSLPRIQRIRDKYKDDLTIIAVHMPRSEKDKDLEQISKMASSHNITEPLFIDGDEKLSKRFGIRQVPSFYLFDDQGSLRYFQRGTGNVQMLKNRLERLFK